MADKSIDVVQDIYAENDRIALETMESLTQRQVFVINVMGALISSKVCLKSNYIGNLVCPAEFQIGEHIKMLICSTAEGSDKPYKYPLAFEKADIILLTKCDLKRFVDFDDEFFRKGIKALNKNVPVFEVNAKTGQGFKEAAVWMQNRKNYVHYTELAQ